ncbi:CPA_1a_G0018290.mRNA.1.CDS.1 [Saccharomyces cerevisiae]|nr:CPA_1a_G0018290.mRNA.1.CDS.1 [Saccharomyces cerevisiae]CAI4469529.1 CCT_1a_G0018300.mRNA.1.CDS.1 [Saccharomyces cerevisiae]CAI5259825.1 ALI_HP2_G0013380.mRNA.1.CDS.1 [Saccharomyces cerevisiae]CAI6459999.1 ALI_HP2_G0013380.mRNA.1.CDS.1 [Saccharomyces cerevisiae]CAI7286128.1 CPA_1a_G0018290.mRNA.1.CDS.1 [Saccharomyces cerevisiae]
MERIDKKFLGASKKIKPDKAIGSLFKAPTIEYVVDEVTRTHQPEHESLEKLLVKLTEDQSSTQKENSNRIGRAKTLL